MVETPWGPSDRLREGRLRPGPATSRADVEMSQRRRLYGAMVASVAERGYAATRLDDLVELSGVSTASFYRLFASKDACFLATSEELLRNALVATEIREDGSWEERVRGALGAFARLVAAQPAASRMLLIDSFVAGPEATTAIDAAVGELERRAVALARESSERAGLPDEVPTAIIGAVQELARDRLRRGRAESLPRLMDVVAEVALSYRPPDEPLAYTGRLPRPREEDLDVPGAAERSIRALAVVAAERGYRQVTVEEVVRCASMSPTTFYAEFADKGEAMLAAIDSAGAQMAAAALPAFRRNDDWPAAVRTAFTDLLAYLASRPALARLVFVEAYAAGPEALRRRAEALRPLTALLAPGSVQAKTLPPGTNEVLWAAIVAMIQRQIRTSGAHSLPALGPILTFIALGPYLGSEDAGASAFGGRRFRSRVDAFRTFQGNAQADLVESALNFRPSTPEQLSADLGIDIEVVKGLIEKMLEVGLVESLEGRAKGDPIGGRYRYSRDHAILKEDVTLLSITERQRLSGYLVANLQGELRESFESGMVTVRPEFAMVRIPMHVDEQGWREVSALIDKAMFDAIAVIEAAGKRLEETGEEPIRATAALLLFEVPRLHWQEPPPESE